MPIPKMSMFCVLFDHFQFTLIHGPNIPVSYVILLFTASDFTSIINHIHNWVLFCFGSISSFFLKLFIQWSPVAYWATTDLIECFLCTALSVYGAYYCFYKVEASIVLIIQMRTLRFQEWSGVFKMTQQVWDLPLGLSSLSLLLTR